MAGIKEIAKITGVSLATVSRVFNQSPLVSEKTRERVLKVARDLDYRPNVMAAALRSGKSKIIGVIVPEVNNLFFSGIINGIERIVSDSGFHIIISQTHEQQDKENTALNSFLELNVGGVLMSISKETEDYTNIQKIIEAKIPIVFFDRPPKLKEVDSVVLDDHLGGYIATEHLIKNNCTQLLHVAGNQQVGIFRDRKDGFLAAAEKHGTSGISHMVAELKTTGNQDLQRLDAIFKANPNIDGIFVYGDEMAIQVLQQLKNRNLKVPEQVKLIGFGNANYSTLIQPQISSIDQENVMMGELAATILLKKLKEEVKPTTKVLSPKLVQRAASKVVST